MNPIYPGNVRLLTRAAPLAFINDTFALKGGTAMNLFLRSMRRCPSGSRTGFRAPAFLLSEIGIASARHAGHPTEAVRRHCLLAAEAWRRTSMPG